MDHKYKTLLRNVKAKHIITEFENAEQIIRLRKLDFNNFFVLGSLESVRNVLGKYNLFKSVTLCSQHQSMA